jgi:hypothetical protein
MREHFPTSNVLTAIAFAKKQWPSQTLTIQIYDKKITSA